MTWFTQVWVTKAGDEFTTGWCSNRASLPSKPFRNARLVGVVSCREKN